MKPTKLLNRPSVYSLPGHSSPPPFVHCNRCKIVHDFRHRWIQILADPPPPQSVTIPSPAKASRPSSMGSMKSPSLAISEQDIFIRMLEKYVLLCFERPFMYLYLHFGEMSTVPGNCASFVFPAISAITGQKEKINKSIKCTCLLLLLVKMVRKCDRVKI